MRALPRCGRTLPATALLLLLANCGGGGSDLPGSGPGPGDGSSVFPERGGGESTEPPASVRTARIVFDSISGEQCCVALPAEVIPAGAVLVLDDLPAGPATVVVAFFAEDFAPSVEGIADTCRTAPVALGSPCDLDRIATPSFESDPQMVNIIAGGQTNVADLIIHALPFLFDLIPGDGDTAEEPVEFSFTVADAVTDIEEESVDLELTLQVPDGNSFRSLSKRVPLYFSPCADGTPEPCSREGDRDVAGFRVHSDPTMLVPGPVDGRITALNQGDPPRAVDFEFGFEVFAAEREAE